MRAIRLLAMTAAVLAALFVPAAALAAPGGAKPAWRACLACHDDQTLTMQTAKGERMALGVSADELAASAHRNVECRGCHPGVRLENHPGKTRVAGLAEYRSAVSKACLECHPASGLRARTQHAAVVFDDQQLRCTECHGAHGVRPVAGMRKDQSANGYCLSCHARELRIQRPDGTSVSLAVDASKLAASVHPKHLCSDCHAGFSASAHPAGVAGDAARRTLAASRACARCHEDKLRLADQSIHFALLRSGKEGAPGCTDCHNAHEVAPAERFATLTGTPCRGCHAQIFEAYSGSMHAEARQSGGHFEAPLCSECHRAHDVRGRGDFAAVRDACIGCHPSAVVAHSSWLPNASLHLDAVACAACHAPKAKHIVALRLVEEGSGRQLSVREVTTLLGSEVSSAFDPKGEGVTGVALWSAVRRLESLRQNSAAKLDVVGRLEVARGIDAHRLVGGSRAIRSCEVCHQSDSPAFGQVAVSLAGDDGRPTHFSGAPGILTDAASVLSVKRFYALGGTRQWVLDWLLVLAVAGGLAVVAMHLTARIWSARSAARRS